MGPASYAFTNDVNRLWRMLENLEAGMIGIVSYLNQTIVHTSPIVLHYIQIY